MADFPPYDFVPVPKNAEGNLTAVRDEPVFHDGKESKDLLSGEILCSLRALTPLLVANHHYKAKQATEARKRGNDIQLDTNWNVRTSVDEKKTIMESLILEDRVLIPGESLKGMTRHVLGAMLGAPMERVQDLSFSYRPNLGFADENQEHIACRPAIVLETKNDNIEVGVFHKPYSVVFVNDNALTKIKNHNINIKPLTKIDQTISGVELQDNGRRKKLIAEENSSADLRGYLYLNYRGGIDGTGILADAHDSGKKIYNHVLVKLENYSKIKLPEKVYNHYLDTQEHLADMQSGHLRQAHPLTEKMGPEKIKEASSAIKRNKKLKKGDLIYVEVVMENNEPHRVVSIGRHFHYRQAYADTVAFRWTPAGMEPRKILSPVEEEKQRVNPNAEHSPPQKLTGPRLMFGYCESKIPKPYQRKSQADNNDSRKNDEPYIGKGDFQKLAGRVSFNMAVEQIEEGQDRFLNPNKGYCVPLKPLSMPRPSAVEFYLDQSKISKRKDAGKLITYGDLPGDGLSGELKGRKFYKHQPDAAREPRCYEDSEPENTRSKISALARFVSKPGTDFKFKVRFRDLRPWELGALLFALQPRLIPEKAPDDWSRIKQHARNAERQNGEGPLYANKLGHGRPLGLGSVAVNADRILFLDPDNSALEEHQEKVDNAFKDALKVIAPMAENGVLEKLLEVQQYRGRTRYDYPRTNNKIHNWHTDLRRKHAKGRRTQRG